MRDTAQEEVRLLLRGCGCGGYKDCDSAKTFGPGDWENGATSIGEKMSTLHWSFKLMVLKM